MGGAGYISTLAIMWVIYPLYLKVVHSVKESVIGISMVFFLTKGVSFLLTFTDNYNLDIDVTYFCRACMSFAAGNLLFYVISERKFHFSKTKVWTYTLILLSVFIVFMIYVNSGWMKTYIVIIMTFLLCIVNYDKPVFILDNCIFSFIGKRIFSIFFVHLLLLNFLGLYLEMNNSFIFIIAALTFVISIFVDKLNYIIVGNIKNKLFVR